jgi:predicted  nucleic acid-binding Zn-ribbon protein
MSGLSALLETLHKLVKEVLKLVKATEQNRSDILETQEQLTGLNDQVRILAYEIKHFNERAEDEREKDILRMENLKLEITQLLLEARLEDRDSGKDDRRKKQDE